MFDPPISTLANRSSELMFDTRTVAASKNPRRLPVAPRTLDFQYEAGGARHLASEFAERTFTDALLIMKDGRIVHEQYLNRTTDRTRFMSYSMAKSFNSIMAGVAIAEGRITSVDDPISKYMPELQGTAYDGLSLKHLLWMRTGARWNDNFFTPGPSRDAHVAAFVESRQRYVTAALGIKERAGPPGVAFNYNSVEAAMVGEIVTRAVGMPLSQYLSEKIWKPAGMESDAFYVLDGPPSVGREFTAGGFNATLRDYGRVGQMMLDRGQVKGRQLVPASWVDESTKPGQGRASAEDGTGYAYLWWTIDGMRAYTMLGGEGQFVFVDPESRTVIIKLSHIPVGPAGDPAMAETFAFLKPLRLGALPTDRDRGRRGQSSCVAMPGH
ncbi:MAG: serine hydrolase [Proteobacteria bacterium]|nr:serine hydrolase [Pseudomonadota bacterium]